MTDRIVLLLQLLLITFFFSCKSKEKEVHPQMRQLTEAVYASGTLQPENEYKVVSTVDGYLQRSFVNEGDSVSVGQPLFQLQNSIKETQLHSANEVAFKTSALTGNNAPQIKELQNALATAVAKLQTDSAQYGRYKRLYEQDATSKSTFEKFWLQFESSQKEVARIQQQIKETKISSSLQMQQAQNAVSLARADKENGNLKSFTSGIVFDILKQEGDLIYPNQPIALIGSGKMIAKLLVDEDDLEKLFVGQKIVLTADAYPNKVFAAHVEKIYPILNKAEQSFRVDAVLDEPIAVKLYGLNLEANIIVAENKNVLVIPKEALLKGDSVLVKKDGKRKMIKITKGIQDNNWLEVKSGVDQSSTIIIQ
jgi:multidrug efflux pump subunit AcrA (membrane-fusion protein)